MSWTVYSGGRRIWEPSLQTGRLFLGQIQALERVVSHRSGVVDHYDDTMEVDGLLLGSFLRRAFDFLDRTNNGPLYAMAAGCLAVAVALHGEITGTWPAVPEHLRPIVVQARTVMRPYRSLPERPDGMTDVSVEARRASGETGDPDQPRPDPAT
jgi:hypothetical protein